MNPSARYPARVPQAPAPTPLHAGPLPTMGELVAEMARLSRALDAANDYLRIAATDYAKAEDSYRMAKARHQLDARGALEEQGRKGITVDDCRAHVDLLTSRERVEAHLTEGLHNAARESVRSKIAQLSALQSVAAAIRGELELGRRAPTT